MNNLLLFMSITGSIPLVLYYFLRLFFREKISAHGYKLLLVVSMLFYLIPTPLFSNDAKEIFRRITGEYQFMSTTLSEPAFYSPSKTIIFTQENMIHPQYSAILQALLTVWGVVGILFLILHFCSYHRIKRNYIQNSTLQETRTIRFAGIPKKIPIRTSSRGNSFSIGVFSPMIFIEEGVTPEERELIYQHEAMHIRNMDCLFRYLSMAAIALHWMNPLAHLLFREIGTQIEYAVDESVMKNLMPDQQKEYGNLILNSISQPPHSLADRYTASFKGNEYEILKERIIRLKNMKNCKKTKRGIAIITAIAALLLNIIPVMAYEPPTPIYTDNFETNDEFTKFTSFDTDTEVTHNFTESDTSFYDENGEFVAPVFDYQIITESDITTRACSHTFVSGIIEKHHKNSDGSCDVYYYNAKRCSKCGTTYVYDLVKSTHYVNCPH